MMYCTFAVMFIAQSLRHQALIGQQIAMLLLLMVTPPPSVPRPLWW